MESSETARLQIWSSIMSAHRCRIKGLEALRYSGLPHEWWDLLDDVVGALNRGERSRLSRRKVLLKEKAKSEETK